MALTPAFWRVFRRRYAVAFMAALLVLVASVVVLNAKVSDTLASTARVGGLSFPPGPAQGGNYLIVGSDSRAFVDNATQEQAFGSPTQETGQRADVMMVLHIDPETKSNYLVSFPRDLLVPDPASPGRKVQINGVLNNGPQAVIDLMNRDFNVKINHYVQVNFQAFIGVVDAIGKIPVYFPFPSRDTFSGLDVGVPGCQPLDGNAALAYVRSRHLQEFRNGSWHDASPRADLDRIDRQQSFIRKLASAASAKAGENPLDAIDIANAVVPKLTVDAQLSNDNILRLVKTFRNVDPQQSGALEMTTIPNVASRSEAGRLDVEYPQAEAVLARLRTFGGSAPSEVKVRPTDVVVSVANGSGKNGAANRAIADLQLRGFGPGDATTASSLVPKTIVRYKPGAKAAGELVSQYLGGVGELVEDPTITDVDVVVVIGADWRGVHGKGQAAEEAPSTTTTTVKPAKGATKPTGPAGPAPAAPGAC